MDKYVLSINGQDKNLKYFSDKVELNMNPSFYISNTKIYNNLNSVNIALIKQALAKHKEGYKSFVGLNKLLHSISLVERANDVYSYSGVRDQEVESFFKRVNPHYVYKLNTNGGKGYVRNYYSQIKENVTLVLEDVRHDHQTMYMTNAKSKMSILKHIKTLHKTDIDKSIDELKALISKLNETLEPIIKYEEKFGAFNASIYLDKGQFLIMYKDFLDALQTHFLNLKENTKDFCLEEVLIKKFEGFLSKVEDKKKSYMYLVKNRMGEVGFLGIKIKKVQHEYSQSYSLKPVKSLSAALIFEDSDYTKCGIRELTNKNLYPVIEVVECAQVFNMQNKQFTDDQMQAFASGLERLKIENFLQEMVPPTKDVEAPKKVSKL